MTDQQALSSDAHWMSQALELARLGLYSTSPNPRVGCVLVKNDQVVGKGWHQRAGEGHAEVLALAMAQQHARGSTAYVTLEPCNHFGRTPPCTEALIEAGVSRVVVAVEDSDPRTQGEGIERLRQAGIRVDQGVCQDEATELNIGFLQRHRINKPWVRMKLASSLDGRVTAPDGGSQWITSSEARADGHLWRARACAVLTGIETLLADDPRLDARCEGLDLPVLQPIRIVLDSHGRIPEHARIWDCSDPVWVISTVAPPVWFERAYAECASPSAKWHRLSDDRLGRVDLGELMRLLSTLQINELHVEAGPTLSGALFEAGWVDELLLYQAPVLLGEGRSMLLLPQLRAFEERWVFEVIERVELGKDQRLRLRNPKHWSESLDDKMSME